MSISNLEQSQLDLIQKRLDSQTGFAFSSRLKSALDPNGDRAPVDPIWLRSVKPKPTLEPVIKVRKSIRPLMSKPDPVEKPDIDMTEATQKDEKADEEISQLLESIQLLSTSSSQAQTQDKLSLFTSMALLPTPQLKKMLASLHHSFAWPEDTVSDFFLELATLEHVPRANVSLLVYAIFYEKIVSLNSSAPRLLMNSILFTAKKEGKAVMNGLLIPLLFQSELAKPQSEVITKTITESLNASQRYSFLKTLLADGEDYFDSNQAVLSDQSRKYLKPWNDSIFQIIHALLSTQPLMSLARDDLESLVRSIEVLVSASPKDKGSMQTLLLLTSKYSQAVVEYEMIPTIEKICLVSNMFLKRAVMGQIATLKKKTLQ